MQSEPLHSVPLNTPYTLTSVGGERSFRRRLLELGLVPGTEVWVRKVAPMGDPLELEVRGCRISIRLHEAQQLTVARSLLAAAK